MRRRSRAEEPAEVVKEDVETFLTADLNSSDTESMRIFNRDLRLQDVTIMYFTALAALMVILVASYQAPTRAVDMSSIKPLPSGALPPLPMPYCVPLDPRGELHLAWNISYASQEIYMELRVAELKHGVLLGMSDQGELTNADLVVLWNTGTKSYFGVRFFFFFTCKAVLLHISS